MTRSRAVSLPSCALLMGLALLPPTTLAAQSPGVGCRFLPGSGEAQRSDFGRGMVVHAKTPNILCNDGRRMRADSVSYFQASGFAEFFGDVFFQDDDRELTADHAIYFEADRRLVATGSVVVEDLRDGSEISGNNLTYYRAGGGRVEDEVTVTGGRPHALLRPRREERGGVEGVPITEGAAESTPWDVTANRIFLRGESYFDAQGEVEVIRDSIRTRSDSLVFNEAGGTLWLSGDARIEEGETVMSGRRIRARIPADEIDELTAFGDATLEADELELDAPWIRVAFREGELDGLWAAPLAREAPGEVPPDSTLPEPAREVEDPEPRTPRDSLDWLQPIAVAESTTIVADSLEIRAPGQELEQLRAVGRARAVSQARDSLNTERTPELARRDWIQGDTIIATFVRSEAPPPDTAEGSGFTLEELVAIGNASSLYRIPMATRRGRLLDPTGVTTAGRARGDSAQAGLTADTTTGTGAPPDTLEVERPGTEEGDLSDRARSSSQELRIEPGIHYVVADRITLTFEEGEIRKMTVDGLLEGVHLEPTRGGPPGSGATPLPTDTLQLSPPYAGSLR